MERTCRLKPLKRGASQSKRNSRLKHKLSGSKCDIADKAKALLCMVTELSEQCIQKEIVCESMKKDYTAKYNSIVEKAERAASKITATAKRNIDNMKETFAQEQIAWEMEKRKMAHIQEFGSQILMDVGGVKLATSRTTLQRFPDSMIGVMFSGRHALPTAGGYFFIDRDGTHFRHILNFLRQPEGFRVDLPSGQLDELKRECDYYGLLEVMFPWSPAEPMSVTATSGYAVRVTQDKDALWYGNSVPLKVCRHCFHAEGPTSASHLSKFTAPPASRVLADAQPQPATCCSCYRAAIKK